MKKILFALCIVCSLCHAQSFKIDLSKAVSTDMYSKSILDNIQKYIVEIPDSVKSKNFFVWLTKYKDKLVITDSFEHVWIFDTNKESLQEVITEELKKDDFIYNSNDKSSKLLQKGINVSFDAVNNLFFKDVFTHWIGIDIKSGEIIKKIQKPEGFQKRLGNCQVIDSGHYVSYVNGSSKDKTSSFIIFNDEGRILYKKDIAFSLDIEKDEPYFYRDFYNYKSNYYCHAPFNGTTVYKISDTELTPYIEFISDKKEQKIERAIETDNYVYFCFYNRDQLQLGHYDKQNKITYLHKAHYQYIFNAFPANIYENRAVFLNKIDNNKLEILIGKLK